VFKGENLNLFAIISQVLERSPINFFTLEKRLHQDALCNINGLPDETIVKLGK